MKKVKLWVVLTLISIIFIAIILRLIKLYEFAIWGSDSGEHYLLINQMIDGGHIQLDYNGWGFTYPYFPGMHVFTSGFAELAGLSAFQVYSLLSIGACPPSAAMTTSDLANS